MLFIKKENRTQQCKNACTSCSLLATTIYDMVYDCICLGYKSVMQMFSVTKKYYSSYNCPHTKCNGDHLNSNSTACVEHKCRIIKCYNMRIYQGYCHDHRNQIC